MNNHRYLPLLGFLSLIIALGCHPGEEQSAIKGTYSLMAGESLLPLLEREAALFQQLYPEIKGSVVSSSTREAIVALLNDSVSVIAVDRPLNAEEQRFAHQTSRTVTLTDFAFDALAVLVHRDNPLPSLRVEHLQDILNRKVTRWDTPGRSGPGPSLRIVMTGPNSGVYELLSRHFFTLNQPLIPDKVVGSQREVFEALALDPGAIGIVSHSFHVQARRDSTLARTVHDVRVVPLVTGTGDSTNTSIPSQRSLYLKEYPLQFTVSLATVERRVGPAAGFATFITSVQGQKIVQEAGLLPVTIPVRLIELTQESIQ